MSDVPVTALWLCALILARRPSTACGDSRRRRARRWRSSSGRTWRRCCCSSRRRAPRCGRAVRSPGRRVFAREPAVDTRDLAAAGGDAWRCRARRDPGRALRIAARVGLRLVRRSVRAVERRAEPGAVSALDDRDAHAVHLALAARAAARFRLLDRRRESLRLDPLRFAVAVVLAYLPYVYFRTRRMVLHAVPAARAAVDDGLGRAGAVERGAPHRTARTGRRRSRRLCHALRRCRSAARHRSAVFGMREGEQKYPRVGGFVRDGCRRPHS